MDDFSKDAEDRLYQGINLEDAVKLLTERNIIRSPEYWINNAGEGTTVKGEYAAILIKRVAEYILSLKT